MAIQHFIQVCHTAFDENWAILLILLAECTERHKTNRQFPKFLIRKAISGGNLMGQNISFYRHIKTFLLN
jgi:hypothetical protein